MPDLVRPRRALLSVSDKTDLVPFARTLASLGIELISTGGTCEALRAEGLDVTPIEDVTGFPEIMDGRVKTLHPKVHGGLLAVRDNDEHADAMRAHAIEPIDLVCINLYPFERTVANAGVTRDEAVEQIDIGGPSMIRSGAKNHAYVTVVTNPRQYDTVVRELRDHDGHTTFNLRASLAGAAFARTSEYDAAIASFLGRRAPRKFEQILNLGYVLGEELRYGENPHQAAALYRDPSSTGQTIVKATQLHGKQLGYNNINDAAAALELVKSLRTVTPDRVGAVVVKHANPCGAAVAGDARSAIEAAIAGDPLAAFGGILAVGVELDASAAEPVCAEDRFFEVVVAPSFTTEAVEVFASRWKNVRLLAVGAPASSSGRRLAYRSIPGGMLVQERDLLVQPVGSWTHAAGPKPTDEQLAVATVMESVVGSLASNAVCVGGTDHGAVRLFGAGAGQMDRLAACRIACEKAGALCKGAVAASDAFFPFPDGPRVLIDAGVSVIVHPGGSKRDDETFALCDERGVTCLTTGVRRFRH